MSYRSLSSSDLRSIERYQNLLSEIHSRDEIIDFSLHWIKRMISCDFVGWNLMHSKKRDFLDARIFPTLGAVLDKVVEPISRTLETHRMFRHYYSLPHDVFETVQITDIVSHLEFLETPIYREAYIHFDARHQLHTQIPSELNHARVLYNVTRKSQEYTDRDKQILDLIGRRTHRRLNELPRIISNNTIMSHFYEAFDSASEGLIRLHADFSVMDMSPSAKQLLKVFFADYGGGLALPLEVQKWIFHNNRGNGVQDIGVSIKKSTTFQRWGRILIAILLKKPNEKYSLLALQEDTMALEEYLATTKGLTRRQRQLFHLLKDGVTDLSEIAHHLGISARTAEGHKINLQRIVGKI